MRRLAPALVLLALGGCGGAKATVVPPLTRTAPAVRTPPAEHRHLPSDGYAITELRGLRLFSRRLPGGRFVLVEQRAPDAPPRRAPGVRSSRLPFQVDLGTDARGRVVAVFGRCALSEPPVRGVSPEVDHCHVSLWAPGSGSERPLPQLDGPRGTSAVWPSIDRGRVSFAREPDVEQDGASSTVWRTASPSASPRRVARVPLQHVTGLQARGQLIAVTGFSTSSRFHGGNGSFPVLLLGDGAPVEELGEGGLGEETDSEPRGLTFIRGEVAWALGDLSGEDDVGRSAVQRYDLRTGSLLSASVRGALTGLAGTSFDGLVGAEAAAEEVRQGATAVHARVRSLPGLRYARVDQPLGEHVRVP